VVAWCPQAQPAASTSLYAHVALVDGDGVAVLTWLDVIAIPTTAPAGTAAVAPPLLQRGVVAVTVHDTAVSALLTVSVMLRSMGPPAGIRTARSRIVDAAFGLTPARSAAL
jgi:hypothetical protein